MEKRWIVMWDFPYRQPRMRTFYQVFADEFGPAEAERIQKSVVMCPDLFTAQHVSALAEYYGANVRAVEVGRQCLPESDGEAEAFVQRIHSQRLSRRGRRAG